jgi:phosphoadenosine phosphosulfate reductase
MTPLEPTQLKREIDGLSPPQMLSWAASRFAGQTALASSLGAEDQVLLDMAAREGLLSGKLPIDLFTLDTGRLFPETLDLLVESEAHYGVRFRVFYPDTAEVEAMVAEAGINLFRRSPEDRHRCCGVRKVAPLRRALQGKALWIVGLRRDQTENRADLEVLSWDEANGLLKLCPLLDWSDSDVRGYLDQHSVPRNPLHAQGFPSIGCAPCTRAVAPGESARAGRWWWEQESQRECGLHLVNGRLVRNR